MTATLPDAPGTDDAHADPLRDALVQAVGAEYELLRLLGRGGMGAVYLARDRALERLVAIKVLPPGAGTDTALIERFRREARTVAALQHGGIVPLHAFGERRGLCWFVMGYVRGESLSARLEREGALPPDVARRILVEVADALDHAHRQGVVHRDIKPDNILLDDASGRALLTDFGIARAETARAATALTQSGAVMGTPHYMAPEQATGEPLDGRSDLYALGVVGYEMLAGRLPFEGRTFRELVLQHVSVTPRPIAEVAREVPADLGEAVMRCLAKEPDARFADAGALRSALGGAEHDDETLSIELGELKHSVAYALIAVLVTATILASAVARGGIAGPMLPGLASGALAGVVMYGFQFREARRKGYAWSEIRRVSTLPPRWWFLPWPGTWRRATDVHARMPRALAWSRGLTAVSLVLFCAFWPVFSHIKHQADRDLAGRLPGLHAVYGVRPLATLPILGDVLVLFVLFGLLMGCWLGSMVLGARVGRRHGLGWLDWQRLTYKPGDSPFWRDPRIAPVLVAPASAAPPEPSTPQEFVTRILDATRSTTPSGTHHGADAASAARRLLEAIGAAERELATLERTASVEQLERVEAELVLLEAEGGDDDAIAPLVAQRDALVRARERAAAVAARRDAAAAELASLWGDVRRLRDTGDAEGRRTLAETLQRRAESIERTWPPRTGRATTAGRTTGATRAGTVALLVVTLAAGALGSQRAGDALARAREAFARDSLEVALATLAASGDDTPARWQLEGDVQLAGAARPGFASRVGAPLDARAAYTRANERDPAAVRPLEQLVWLHRLTPALLGGRTARADDALRTLDRIAPYRARLLRGYLARLDGDDRTALATFRALTTAFPDSAPAWFALADVAAPLHVAGEGDPHAGRIDLAIEALARYRALAPDDPSADFHVGHLSAHLGVALADGEAALVRYVAAPRRAGLPRLDVAWWYLGQVREKRGLRDGALAAYRTALALDPEDADFRASLEALEGATTR